MYHFPAVLETISDSRDPYITLAPIRPTFPREYIAFELRALSSYLCLVYIFP
jgi:hypothetical protein